MKLSSLTQVTGFGIKIEDIDLRRGSDAEIRELKNGLYKHGIVSVADQDLSEKEYIEFGQRLGIPKIFVDEEYRHPEFREIFVVSNVKREGKRFGMDRVGYYWHSDCSFLSEPQPLTMLYAQIAPDSGGETAFIDMRRVFNSLPLKTQELLADKNAEHEGQSRYIITEADVGFSIKEVVERDRLSVPRVVHPMVLEHPYTGEKALYVNEGFTHKILDIHEKESRNVLNELFQLIRESTFHYKHKWAKKEIVIWDNRLVVHRAYPSQANQPRLLFRLGISDGSFFSERTDLCSPKIGG